MAGVLGQLFRPPKKAMYRDPKAMELETAKEILAEVYWVRLSEVDEVIQNRIEEVHTREVCCEGDGLWGLVISRAAPPESPPVLSPGMLSPIAI